jgi:membrane protein
VPRRVDERLVASSAASRKRAERTLAGAAKEFAGTWVELFRENELLTYASAIARQTLLAAVALALLLLGLLPEIGREDLWYRHVAPQIRERVLPEVFAGANETVRHIFAGSSWGLVLFAALLSIWEVSGSVRAMMGSFNRVYEAEETRSWKRRYPLSIALSAVIIASLLASVLLVMAAGGAVHGAAYVPFAIVRWLVSVLLIALAFGLLVRYAPAERRAKRWATLGATLVVVGWIVESLLFKWYVTSLADFKSAVGSLTVFLVLIGYLYTGSIILLVGIELDELAREDRRQAERTLLEIARGLRG